MADYTDNFNRADNYALGSPWVESELVAYALRVYQNRCQAYIGSAWGYAYWNEAFTDNQYSQLMFVTDNNNPGKSGPAVRTSGVHDSFTGYVAIYDPEGTKTVRLYKYVNQHLGATGTALGTYAVTLVNGDILRIEVVGSNIKVFVNGTERIDATDSEVSTGKAGIVGLGFPGGANPIDWDDWAGGDAEAPPPPTSGFHHQVMQV